MTEHRPLPTFVMPIPEHVSQWMDVIEMRKLERRFLLLPFLSVLAGMICATIVLSVLLWHFPGSTDAVARLFATEMIHGYFPTAKRANSYLGQMHGEPWGIFLPAILAINMASCLAVTVFFSVWMSIYPLAIANDADRRNSDLIARSRSAAGAAILGVLLGVAVIVFVVSLGWFAGDPSRDLAKARKSIAGYIVIQHLLIMFLPSTLIMIAFLFKFRRTLKRLNEH